MAYLLNSLQAGRLRLDNRLVMPPMATYKGQTNGQISQEILDYYKEKSQGGYIGLVIIEHSYVAPEGRAGVKQVSVADDSCLEGLRKLAVAIHANGPKTVMQINHAGSHTTREIAGQDPVGPSAVVNPRQECVPRELDNDGIAGIVKAFQAAALRVKKAGFDGVEIHSAHGYLLNQFLSPVTNHRTDDYGGGLMNRIRIHLEVIEAVRQAVGADYPVLLRLGVADFMPGGTSVEDVKSAAQAFARAGIDIIDLSGGVRGWNLPELKGPGFLSSYSAAVKEAVSIPVILTGGITQAEEAEKLLAEGKADLIGVGRAILQDSDWARKAVESLKEFS